MSGQFISNNNKKVINDKILLTVFNDTLGTFTQ